VVQSHRAWRAGWPAVTGRARVRSSLTASARTLGPKPTTTDISTTPAVGAEVITRWTSGC
jgi:hypothetical protein